MVKSKKAATILIYTIGHSTRSDEDMLELLKNNHVRLLADVRTVPKSRTNPQFNSEEFRQFLCAHNIQYEHMKVLGGLRRPRKDSSNTVWENESFRGYADYMESAEFRQGVDRLLEIAEDTQLAIMCSEAVWWRCHRSMIADELVARGINVEHIMAPGKCSKHKLRNFAHVQDGHVSYH
jgi:uncharacterized protein (DUF488 family)